MKKNGKYLICKKPFEWLEVHDDPTRSAYACCSGWLNIPIGPTLDANGEARVDAMSGIWKSGIAKSLRKSVVNGSFRYCNSTLCPHLSDISGPVQYVDETEYEQYRAMALSTSAEEDFFPKTLNCAYDRSCNLACPSCRKDLIVANKNERSMNDKYIQKLLRAYGDKLEELYITGSGDPFGSRHYWDLLRGDELLKYPNLNLRLHTNAQMLTQERWDRIAHLHHKISLIEVSIDGASVSTYEENRFPGKWDLLVKNMDFLAKVRQKGELKQLKIAFVVQRNNWREMASFVKLGRKWNADTIYFSPLNNWGTFTEQDYQQRAVHLADNDEYSDFKEYLLDNEFHEKDIELGFFSKINEQKEQVVT